MYSRSVYVYICPKRRKCNCLDLGSMYCRLPITPNTKRQEKNIQNLLIIGGFVVPRNKLVCIALATGNRISQVRRLGQQKWFGQNSIEKTTLYRNGCSINYIFCTATCDYWFSINGDATQRVLICRMLSGIWIILTWNWRWNDTKSSIIMHALLWVSAINE